MEFFGVSSHESAPRPDPHEGQKPLDDEQRAAVESFEQAIAVLAGPGSGKTRVLSYRARRLLMNDAGSRALLLTFTNKAAAEMKARALGVAPVSSNRIQASTFHTFGMRILRAHGDLVGIDRDFEILDREDQELLVAKVARKAGVSGRPRRWSYLRLRREDVVEESVAKFGDAYEEEKRRADVVDFDDLIVYTADLLKQHPEIAEAYGHQFRHLLVDEFQDTNAAQFVIVKALCAHTETVSVFADDDQAIYRFVGAEAENIRRFIEQLGAREYPLTFNYRCRRAIIEHANRLIAADPDASGRQMRPVYDGGHVRHISFADIAEEAVFISTEIAELIDGKRFRPSDLSILARSGWRAGHVLKALEQAGVPTSNWLGESYEPLERRTLAVVLSVIRSRLNDRQAQRLCELLGVELTHEREIETFLDQYQGAEVVYELRRLRDMAYCGEPIIAIVRQAQVAAVVARPQLREPLETIVQAVIGFAETDAEFTLEHLLSELALGGVGGPPTAGGGVKIASLHRTKGLQWPRVYIMGLETDTLPDYRAVTRPAVSEERRICFVGVSRAETHLTLTRIRHYRGYLKEPSIFLEEMGIDPYEE
ncbi:MAG TPA: ATP-dependent helicase [Thermoanaerobaculia bacterium]|nr:ATP-dependent helicase [Thermoanaerobaculia bacterium]